MSSLSTKKYDVIVIGGGHAGVEACLATARMGHQTLLLTHNLDTIGQLSCNPSIGGIGKSHLVKEIDALGGVMARATDLSGIQFRILNASKGPAVRATRVQIDRNLYKQAINKFLNDQQNLHVLQQAVDDLIIENHKIIGVKTNLNLSFYASTVILTVGTFLNGKIHTGMTNYAGGRSGDPASITLANNLRNLPFNIQRLKTGTPPRIASNSINYQILTEQQGDLPIPKFSVFTDKNMHPIAQQVSCYITHTNEITHEIIRNSLNESPLYTGIIEGTGPRYCPSIEDKISRFADKTSHQVFLEPEGLHSNEIYPNGISTSLPFTAQWELVRSMKGCEQAHLLRPGYAIEYDFCDPRDLKLSLESKHISGLFLAGQINGTTGYEEAGAQGLVAGINAGLYINNQESWLPKRNEAYIGVMLEDLVTKGTQEPYRMFTSRAEYRLLLREDNADLRLTEIGYKLGVVNAQQWSQCQNKIEAIEREKQRLNAIIIHPQQELGKITSQQLNIKLEHEYHALDLLRRHEINAVDLMQIQQIGPCSEDNEVIEQIDIQMKYEGYIKRQLTEIERQKRNEETLIPEHIDYNKIIGLSTEVRQKLNAIKPKTIGMASRISGVTPASISILLIYVKKHC